jgi:putative ABC transport system substrate-binding protein
LKPYGLRPVRQLGCRNWPSNEENYLRSAALADRILKGARPSELPVEQPTKFELIINLKTAKALGLTIPESFPLRADELIE